MALMGIQETDRNPGNILINRFTKQPMQIDYNTSDEVGPLSRKAGAFRGDYKQTRALKNATTDGLEAAGLFEEAEIFNGVVNDYLEKGDLTNAWDIAKQGFSRLQKINAATLKDEEFLKINALPPLEGTKTRERILQELRDEGLFTFPRGASVPF